MGVLGDGVGNVFTNKIYLKFILSFGYYNMNLHFFSSTFTLKLFWKCFTNPEPTENNARSHGIKWIFCDKTNQCGGDLTCQRNETKVNTYWLKKNQFCKGLSKGFI
jgi:hypothetical protein